MADTEKTVIIKIDLDVNEYTKKSVELNKEVKELTDKQKLLTKSGETTGLAFQQNKEKLTTLNRELRENNKVIQDVTRSNTANAGSHEQLKAQLSILTAQYNKLSEEERENSHAGKEMAQNVAAVTSVLKQNEAAVGDNRRNVGNYGDALKDLKTQLKEAKGEMLAIANASGADSKEFAEAAKKAGQLKDKMDDVNASVKAMSTGSGIGAFKNQLGLVGSSLKELDFKEAAERAKGLSNIAKNITFKETIEGAKAFGSSLLEMGKAIVQLPIFWIVAGIAAIVAGVVLLGKATSESAQKQVDALDRVNARYQAIYDGQIKLNNAIGKSNDEVELKKLIATKVSVDKQIEILTKAAGEVAGLSKLFGVSGITDEQKKQLEELKATSTALIYDIAAIQLSADKKKHDSSVKTTEALVARTEKLAAANKKQIDENAEAQKKANEQRLADNQKYLQLIEDQKIGFIADDENRELANATLVNARRQVEIEKSTADNDVKFLAWLSQEETYQQNLKDIRAKWRIKRKADFDKQVDDEIKADQPRIKAAEEAEEQMAKNAEGWNTAKLDDYLKTLSLEEKAQKEHIASMQRLQNEAFEATKTAVDGIAQIRANARESEIIGIQEETKIKIDNLQAQADAGIITQDEFQTQSNRIKLDAQKKESEIKKKQFEESKKVALIQVAIKTAQGVMTAFNAATPYEIAAYVALALATGALEAAVIQSQPTPAFASGGKVLSGQRIGNNDGRPIQRSNGDNLLASVKTGEVILNERQQQMLGGDKTFQRMGIRGFAEGGFVDGGTFQNSLVNTIDERIFAGNQARIVAESLPPSIVVVQDINDVQGRTARVADRADI